jgi:hypothetical protein
MSFDEAVKLVGTLKAELNSASGDLEKCAAAVSKLKVRTLSGVR